jgi:hypothetical protein
MEQMSGTPDVTSAQIDRLSLEQALLDAELAIARSRDLALRLVEVRAQLGEAREENLRLRAELEQSRGLYSEITGNRAYGIATKVWAVRRAFGAQ